MSEPMFDARTTWSLLAAYARAAHALGEARQLMLMSKGGGEISATTRVLYEGTVGILRELGQEFARLRATADPEARRFVEEAMAATGPMPEPEPVCETVPPTDPADAPPPHGDAEHRL